MNFSAIAKRYLTRYFFIDVLCCYPQFIFVAVNKFYMTEEELLKYLRSPMYKVLLYLKLFKLLLLPRIFDVTATLQSIILKRYYMKRHLINNIFNWIRTLI